MEDGQDRALGHHGIFIADIVGDVGCGNGMVQRCAIQLRHLCRGRGVVHFAWKFNDKVATQLFHRHSHTLDAGIEGSVDQDASHGRSHDGFGRMRDVGALFRGAAGTIRLLGGAACGGSAFDIFNFVFVLALQKATTRSINFALES